MNNTPPPDERKRVRGWRDGGERANYEVTGSALNQLEMKEKKN